MNLLFVVGIHRVLATSLVSPRPEYRLRQLDPAHVEALKQELLSRPRSSCKTMLVIAQGLKDKKDFDENEVDSYALEVIGGNHRREVILQILSDDSNQSKDCFKFVYVQIYAGMNSSIRLIFLRVLKENKRFRFIDRIACLNARFTENKQF